MNSNLLQIVFHVIINPKIGWKYLEEYYEERGKRLDLKEEFEKYKHIYFLTFIFALFPALGHFLGMTVFKNLYIPDEMLEYLKNEPNGQQTLIYLERLKEIMYAGDLKKILMLVGMYYVAEFFRPIILGALVFFLGGSFGGEKNPYKAFSIAVIALVPSWIANFFIFYNSLFSAVIIFLATFYTVYLVFIGGEKILKIPSENSKNFQFAIVLGLLYLIISAVFGGILVQTLASKIIFL